MKNGTTVVSHGRYMATRDCPTDPRLGHSLLMTDTTSHQQTSAVPEPHFSARARAGAERGPVSRLRTVCRARRARRPSGQVLGGESRSPTPRPAISLRRRQAALYGRAVARFRGGGSAIIGTRRGTVTVMGECVCVETTWRREQAAWFGRSHSLTRRTACSGRLGPVAGY